LEPQDSPSVPGESSTPRYSPTTSVTLAAWTTDQVSQPGIPIGVSDLRADRKATLAQDIKEMEQLRATDSWNYIHEHIEETGRLTAVKDITRSVLESMRPPYVCEDLPREDHDLFQFVSEFVHGRLTREFDSWVDELTSQHGDEMGEIWDASHRREGKLQQLEDMRRRKSEKQEKRKERFGIGRVICAAIAKNWQNSASKQLAGPTTEIPTTMRTWFFERIWQRKGSLVTIASSRLFL
jgi:hypothetical protein